MPGDTSRAVFVDPPRPPWESVLYWPYRVATAPLHLVSGGIGAAIEYLDEEKVLYRVGRLLAPRRGPFGVLIDVQAGGLSGFGGGFTAEHDALFGRGNLFRLHGATTTRGDHRVSLGVRFPMGAERAQGALELGAGYRVRPNARYFDLGPRTRARDESFYRQELGWVGTSLRRRLDDGLFAEGGILYSSISAGTSAGDEDPAIEARFPGALPHGYGIHTYGWTLGAELAHANGPGGGRPARGGLRRVRASRFLSASRDKAEFWSFRGEAQQYLTLWYPHRVLALRGFASWIESTGDDPLPFQRLLTNNDPDLLRGYEDFRFRDRGMAVFSAEYRWPFWANESPDGSGLDLYLLSDVGQVFGRAGDLSVENVTTSYGAGIRIVSVRGFLARVEFARSEEQSMWRLRADQIFQFAKGSPFFGRDPVPDR